MAQVIFSQEAFPCSGSNHILIFLCSNWISFGPRLFKFELMWFEIPGFQDKIKKWWEEFVVEGSTSYRLEQKLKLFKERIVK